MANFEDLANNLRAAMNEIRSTRHQETLILGNQALSLVRLRIQNSKVDENGNIFGTYSQAVVPRSYFHSKITKKAQKRLKKKGWFVSYEDVREASGFDTDAYNFTFTGRFFRELNAQITSSNEDTTTVQIAGSDYAETILNGQSDRLGKSILLLSESEQQILNDANAERINNILNKYL